MKEKQKVLRGPRAGSRRAIMEALGLGESAIFYGEPGASLQSLQSSVSSTYRGPDTLAQQGLIQKGGVLMFEGELPIPVTRVTRVGLSYPLVK